MNTMNDITEGAPVRPPKKRALYRWSLLIFVCGMLVGAGLTVIGIHAFMSYQFRHPEQVYMRVVEHALSGINLTPEQRRRVEDVAKRKEAELSALFANEFRTRVDAHFDSLREEVASVLDDTQAAQWRKKFAEMRARSFPPFPPPQEPSRSTYDGPR